MLKIKLFDTVLFTFTRTAWFLNSLLRLHSRINVYAPPRLNLNSSEPEVGFSPIQTVPEP